MCRGSAKYVHVKCLQRWIDEKHRQNPTLQVHCPQCNYAYHINYPQMGRYIAVWDRNNYSGHMSYFVVSRSRKYKAF